MRDLISLARQSPYPLSAFIFVQRGLDYTVKKVHGEPDKKAKPESRHVSGQQLCLGLREYAIQEYGLLARTVLRRWKIQSCQDFGRIVFMMVDAGLMHKTEEDSLEDFMGHYDFDQAFAPELSLAENV